jgi:hypothetical protein
MHKIKAITKSKKKNLVLKECKGTNARMRMRPRSMKEQMQEIKTKV